MLSFTAQGEGRPRRCAKCKISTLPPRTRTLELYLIPEAFDNLFNRLGNRIVLQADWVDRNAQHRVAVWANIADSIVRLSSCTNRCPNCFQAYARDDLLAVWT